MSFGPSAQTKTAFGNLENTSNQLLNTQFPRLSQYGTNMFNLGGPTFGAGTGAYTGGTNFLNTILGGSPGNTAALLAPDIARIQSGNQEALQAASTLMPRGGGRSGSLFNLATGANPQVQSLFNNARVAAASTLPQLGLSEQGVGTNLFGQGANLFGLGNQALGTAGSVNANLGNLGLQQQELTNRLWSGLGGGLFNLLTAPLGGTLLGKGIGALGGIFRGGGSPGMTPAYPDLGYGG